MKDLAAATLGFLRDESRVRPGDRLIIAVSGGVDSVVLAHLFSRSLQVLQVELILAHAHHGLRPEADDDAEFVGRIAATLGLPLRVGRLPVTAEAQETGESLEMAGRRLRHAFLAEVANSEGARVVALAHHADDQAELILLRLLRGSGGDGLGGMPPQGASFVDPSITLIRPLLGFSKDELIAYAREAGLSWREDSSNGDSRFLRNRIRNHLLPLLEREYQPRLRQVLNRTATIIGAEADWAEQVARRWLESDSSKCFDKEHVAIQRAVLRLQAWELGVDLDFDTLERLRTTRKPVTVAGGKVWIRTEEGQLQACHSRDPFGEDEMTIDIRKSLGLNRFGDMELSCAYRPAPLTIDLKSPPPGVTWLDAERVGQLVRIRYWQPGDRFHPLGMPKPALLQNIFVNRKVPASVRRSLGVAETSAGEIFWVETLPPAEPFKVAESTREILEWRCLRSAN